MSWICDFWHSSAGVGKQINLKSFEFADFIAAGPDLCGVCCGRGGRGCVSLLLNTGRLLERKAYRI